MYCAKNVPSAKNVDHGVLNCHVLFAGDGMNGVLQGVLRGAGRQVLGACLNIFGYWCVGVPLAATLGLYLKLNVLGFWTALAITTSMQTVIQILVISKFDWNAEVKRAKLLVAEHADVSEVKGLLDHSPSDIETTLAHHQDNEEQPLLSTSTIIPDAASLAIASTGTLPVCMTTGVGDSMAGRDQCKQLPVQLSAGSNLKPSNVQ